MLILCWGTGSGINPARLGNQLREPNFFGAAKRRGFIYM